MRTIVYLSLILLMVVLFTPFETAVTINGRRLYTERATTDAERYRGLSNHQKLAPDEGMLFIYSEPMSVGFLMRDMNFAIDIAFVASNRVVTKIARTIQPDSEQTHRARGQYVIEAPAGWLKGGRARVTRSDYCLFGPRLLSGLR